MHSPPVIIHPLNPSSPGASVLPPYVEHGGEISNRHPAAAKDARLYGFVVQADRGLLDRWCDRNLNEPSGHTEAWEALGEYLLLVFIDIPRLSSTDPLDLHLGWTPEREVALWVPVVDLRRARVAWAVPYIWVDSGLVMAGGRETYGFPKQIGEPAIPAPTGDAPDKLSLRVHCLKQFGPDSMADRHTLVTVERPAGQAAEGLGHEWGDRAEDAVAYLEGLLGGPADPEAVFAAIAFFWHQVEGRMPMVLLKQFRDAARPGAACYQAVVEVANTVTAHHGSGLLPNDYTVGFEKLAGQPVDRELGLRTAAQTPVVSFWAEFDFTVHLGSVLWEAGRH